jgi:thioredoxin-like negative regulator of GroEL
MADPRPSSPPPWKPSSPPIDAESLEDVISGPKTIIHFWAPWNPHDRPLDTRLQQLRPKFPRLRFFAANADDTAFTAIMEIHHVAALPALVCFSSGRSLGRFYGVESLDQLEAFLAEMTNMSAR